MKMKWVSKSVLTRVGLILCGKGKKKVKLSLCLTKHHAIKAYWGTGVIAPRILNLGTRWR
jgi:hypothetical protein